MTSASGTFHSRKYPYNLYKSGPNPQYSPETPTGRHKNYCAYVVDKTVSFTVQDGAAPYVKAEYNKCAWGQKCPALMYRLFYKPTYKVAYKTVTELEWRCCPGFSGVGCNTGPAGFPHGMKAMPPFKGPMPPFQGPMPSHEGPMPVHKGPMPVHKGPMPVHKGPMSAHKGPLPSQKGPMPPFNMPVPSHKGPVLSHKGPMPSYKRPRPFYKGPMSFYRNSMHKGNPWIHSKAPASNMITYPGPQMRPPMSSNHGSSFEPYSVHQEPQPHPETIPGQHDPLTDDHEPLPDHHDPIPVDSSPDHGDPIQDHHDNVPEHQDPIGNYQEPLPDQNGSTPDHPDSEQITEEHAPPGGKDEDSVTAERLDQMEVEVQRLSQGLETLRGTVTGLEDGLRASLREDANRMLSALLSAAPAPMAAPALSTRDSSVEFGDLPGGAPDLDGLNAGHFPNLGELVGKVEELRAELQTKAAELVELRGTILGHDRTLKSLTGRSRNLTESPEGATTQKTLEKVLESKLGGERANMLEGFERRVEAAEQRCEGQAAEVRRQCQMEHMEGQEQLEQTLEGSAAGLRKELNNLHVQLQGLEPEDGCCSAVSGLAERVMLLEQSVGGLNESQIHLRVELSGHKDHVEGMLEGRLGYVEAKLNITGKKQGGLSGGSVGNLETRLERKLTALEERLFTAMEELGNVTAPALLEGQAVPTLETEVESLRKRVEVDTDRVQKQLSTLEVLCTSSCAPRPILTGNAAPLLAVGENENENLEKLIGRLDRQADRLDKLNSTLRVLNSRVSDKQNNEYGGLQGEVTFLKVSVRSVNRSLHGLQDSVGMVVQEVDRANATWQQREERLAQQVRGLVQLVSRQASMLGTGERKLTRLKGELQDLRRRLAGELQGCRSTALSVKKEVTDVGGRVARVEGQCGGLTNLAEDLERIRGELERQSDEYLAQVNGTLVRHSLQLSELRDGLKNCTGGSYLSESRGDQVTGLAQSRVAQYMEVQAHPRGDQFAIPVQLVNDQYQNP
ncbi:EMILIN-3 [Chanos chanos]|uniref:EMILIN-3 n=1 Tax=Chanos chanos TaxID=29144 RepID=A0A6J2W9N5_CHACN|nr:EMILIN-3-like [Chanos chanos]